MNYDGKHFSFKGLFEYNMFSHKYGVEITNSSLFQGLDETVKKKTYSVLPRANKTCQIFQTLKKNTKKTRTLMKQKKRQ